MRTPELPTSYPDFRDGFADFPWPASAQFHRWKNNLVASLATEAEAKLDLAPHYPGMLNKPRAEIHDITAHALAVGYFLITRSRLRPLATVHLEFHWFGNAHSWGAMTAGCGLPEEMNHLVTPDAPLLTHLRHLQIQSFDCVVNAFRLIRRTEYDYNRASQIYITNLRAGTPVIKASQIADTQLKRDLHHLRQETEATMVEEVVHAFYWSGNWPNLGKRRHLLTQLKRSMMSLSCNSDKWDPTDYNKEESEFAARIWVNEYLSRYYPHSPVTDHAQAELAEFASHHR